MHTYAAAQDDLAFTKAFAQVGERNLQANATVTVSQVSLWTFDLYVEPCLQTVCNLDECHYRSCRVLRSYGYYDHGP